MTDQDKSSAPAIGKSLARPHPRALFHSMLVVIASIAVTLSFIFLMGAGQAEKEAVPALTQTPVFVDVAWEASPASLKDAAGETPLMAWVLSRSDGLLFRNDSGRWVQETPQIGFQAVHSRTGSRIIWNGATWKVYAQGGAINVLDYGARADYDLKTRKGTDDSGALQAAFDEAGMRHPFDASPGKSVYLPGGNYLVSKPLNLTTDLQEQLHCGINVKGDGRAQTLIFANTGSVLFDTTGSRSMGFEDFRVLNSHVSNPSKTAFLFARGKKNFWSHLCRVSRVEINMGSDPAANDGIGTVGIWNYGGEHHTYTDVVVIANLPVALTAYEQPETLPASIKSSFVETWPGQAPSQHFTNFVGTCTLQSRDGVRPCLLVNRAAEVHLGGTYLQVGHTKSGPLPYPYAVELLGCYQFTHHGMLEGPPAIVNGEKAPGYGYLRNPVFSDALDVRVLLVALGDALPGPSVPLIDLTPRMQFHSGIYNSTIDIRLAPAKLSFPEQVIACDENEFSSLVGLQNTRITTTNGPRDPSKFIPAWLFDQSANTTLYDYRSDRSAEIKKGSKVIQSDNF